MQTLRDGIGAPEAMGSPIVRTLCASDREHLPPGPVEQHIETMIKVFRAVRSEAMDAGLKIAIENHKDLQAWEMRRLIEGAGKEIRRLLPRHRQPGVRAGGPAHHARGTRAPLAVTVHLRDSVVYEHPRGVAVQWVPLGEGMVDFKRFVARMKAICPPVHVYIKPITGRPPQMLPWLEPDFWKLYPKARAADLARFLALAKKGRPYEGHVVIEDLPGRQTPEHFAAAVQFQQRDHMERSIAYAQEDARPGRAEGRPGAACDRYQNPPAAVRSAGGDPAGGGRVLLESGCRGEARFADRPTARCRLPWWSPSISPRYAPPGCSSSWAARPWRRSRSIRPSSRAPASNYKRDLDLAQVAFAPRGKYFLLRGRFDWKALPQLRRGGRRRVPDAVCRMTGSAPDRRIGFFAVQPGIMAMAVSPDDSAVESLRSRKGAAAAGALPGAPVWVSLPPSTLRSGVNLPAGTRMFARGMETAESVILSLAPDSRPLRRLGSTVRCRSVEDAAGFAAQLNKTTTLLRDLIAREQQKPNPGDLSGVLTSGAFRSEGRAVPAYWPIERAFIDNLLSAGTP